MKIKTVTIKLGGAPAANEDTLGELGREIAGLVSSFSAIIVHGGGDEVTELTRCFGIEPVFEDGVRMTSPKEMKFVDMVLCGHVNKRLVRRFQKEGLDAVGLSGSDGRLFIGKSIGGSANSRTHTGRITGVQPRIIERLLEHRYLPVIAPASMDDMGEPLNINADSVAFEIASALKSDALVFISDIPGILKEGKPIASLSTQELLAEIGNGTITGGMIPKAKASIDALSRGVGRIIIGEYAGSGSLKRLLDGSAGTRIV